MVVQHLTPIHNIGTQIITSWAARNQKIVVLGIELKETLAKEVTAFVLNQIKRIAAHSGASPCCTITKRATT